MGTFDHFLREPAKTSKTPETPGEPDRGQVEVGFCGADIPWGAEDFEERSAIIQFDAGVPQEWADGYASLLNWMPATFRDVGYPAERWQQVIDDGGRFLDQWGAQAAALGWQAVDVFGVHPDAPTARMDAMGLVFLINGGSVVAITADSACVMNSGGRALTYYRRRTPGAAMPVWAIS